MCRNGRSRVLAHIETPLENSYSHLGFLFFATHKPIKMNKYSKVGRSGKTKEQLIREGLYDWPLYYTEYSDIKNLVVYSFNRKGRQPSGVYLLDGVYIGASQLVVSRVSRHLAMTICNTHNNLSLKSHLAKKLINREIIEVDLLSANLLDESRLIDEYLSKGYPLTNQKAPNGKYVIPHRLWKPQNNELTTIL